MTDIELVECASWACGIGKGFPSADHSERGIWLARRRSWDALVRMARAHRAGQAAAGQERDIFMWLPELDGDRDQIIASADAQAAAPTR